MIETPRIQTFENVLFEELSQKDAAQIVELNNALVRHLGKFPCFLNRAERTQDMINICGAYLQKEYRGNGIFDALLFYTENIFAAEGFLRMGVDFESFNPTAYGFWLKHFTAYTYSVVRRVDERPL